MPSAAGINQASRFRYPSAAGPPLRRTASTTAVSPTRTATVANSRRPSVTTAASAGTHARTTRYVPRNHSSCTLVTASGRSQPGPSTRPAISTSSVDAARKYTSGRTSRWVRRNSQGPQAVPAARPRAPAAAPAKKNSGSTCNSQVSGCRTGRSARTLPKWACPSRTVTVSIRQWPTTTTTSEDNRSRSSTRSRSAGVFAATTATPGTTLIPETFADPRSPRPPRFYASGAGKLLRRPVTALRPGCREPARSRAAGSRSCRTASRCRPRSPR